MRRRAGIQINSSVTWPLKISHWQLKFTSLRLVASQCHALPNREAAVVSISNSNSSIKKWVGFGRRKIQMTKKKSHTARTFEYIFAPGRGPLFHRVRSRSLVLRSAYCIFSNSPLTHDQLKSQDFVLPLSQKHLPQIRTQNL